MRVVIAHNGVKRVIEGTFSICMSAQDRQSLLNLLGKETHAGGWTDIFDVPRDVVGEPIDWKRGSE